MRLNLIRINQSMLIIRTYYYTQESYYDKLGNVNTMTKRYNAGGIRVFVDGVEHYSTPSGVTIIPNLTVHVPHKVLIDGHPKFTSQEMFIVLRGNRVTWKDIEMKPIHYGNQGE